MTSWKRKQNNQHKEVLTPKYRQRVVPLIRNEKLQKAKRQEEKRELEELFDELNSGGSSGTPRQDD